MFCRRCGKYNPDNRKDCGYCGGPLSQYPPQQNNYQDYSSYGVSKTGIGVLLGLFLGLIGLIIGVCIYPSGSYERQTFIKGWLIIFVIEIVLSIIVGAIYGAVIAGMLSSYGYY